ncbi:hypothetical protein MSPP1_003946 [Malassezia sp. CBS 17886]|nr:hypothetical protein MSPP1_003946 [Malassezia sp. CBS 17886]
MVPRAGDSGVCAGDAGARAGPLVRVAAAHAVDAGTRHHITLRNRVSHAYHSVLLFAFAGDDALHPSYYCMEAACPHLGAPLEGAALEDAGDDDIEDLVVVCPWHQYDFHLRSGESSTGLRSCVYGVHRRGALRTPAGDAAEPDAICIEPPTPACAADGSSVWEVVEVRAVVSAAGGCGTGNAQGTERVERGPAPVAHATGDAAPTDVERMPRTTARFRPEQIPPPDPCPRTLVAWAALILRTPSPIHKVAYTRHAADAFRNGQCRVIGGGRWHGGEPSAGMQDPSHGAASERVPVWTTAADEQPPVWPPRAPSEHRVQPGSEGKRGKGGTEKSRIALLHALANIEQWAIDLAWDIIARAPRLSATLQQGPASPCPRASLPVQFYADFVKVAVDEAKHFTLLQQRLLEMGSYFGALSVHHGLWESALETSENLLARLSIIHLVHEARGLDVNPITIRKFRAAGDLRSVDILNVIHLDEITHVSAGHRWLTFLCQTHPTPLDPVQVFRGEVRRNFWGKLKGPFNAADREAAGLAKDWYEDLDVLLQRTLRPRTTGTGQR